MSRGFLLLTGLLSALMFAGVWRLTAPPPPIASPPLPAARPVTVAPVSPSPVTVRDPAPRLEARRAAPVPAARRVASVHYGGCNEVRALGLAPLHRDDPGYREDMDGDGDGLACEPHR